MRDPITLHPQWRQAVKDFLQERFQPGAVISHAWFEEHFGMQPVDADAPLTVHEHQARQFAWLRDIDALRTELLEIHQICLASVHGEGYRVVPPEDQTAFAQERFERESSRIFRQAAVRLKNVKQETLSEGQRRENLDAIGRLAMLRGMTKASLE